MGKAAPQLQRDNPATALASAALHCARRLQASGIAAVSWLGRSPLDHVFDAGQGLDDADGPARFQAVIRRGTAQLAQTLAPPSPGYMSALLLYAEQACLPPHEIDPILSAMARRKGMAALAAPRARQQFRLEHAPAIRASVCFVTLGLPCVPWKMLNRWGLRPASDFVSGFSPFSLARHRMPGVVRALQTNFADYCRPDDLMMVKTMQGEVVPARKDRQVLWTHHRGSHWADNDYAALIANLGWKIANFRAACRRPNAVFVMSNITNEFPEEPLAFLPRLQEALRQQTGRPDNWLILTNQAASDRGSSLHRVDDTTVFLRCPYPVKGYSWNDDENFDSPEGLAFERSYIELVCQAVREWGLVERSDPAAAPEA